MEANNELNKDEINWEDAYGDQCKLYKKTKKRDGSYFGCIQDFMNGVRTPFLPHFALNLTNTDRKEYRRKR